VSVLELSLERAVAGGRMLARHEGVVVLTAGGIPGERVRARVERSTASVIWARVEDVIEPSAARRRPTADPLCGGMAYAHIAYGEQLRLKQGILADAFRRIGRTSLEGVELRPVESSPEQAYRLRARLHARGGRVGFFREGTHALCDAAATGQLRTETVPAAEHAVALLGARAGDVLSATVAENVAATERVVLLEIGDSARVTDVAMRPIDAGLGLTGVVVGVRGRARALAGAAHVTETADTLFGGDLPVPAATRWVRQPGSFFQGNRFLTGALARAVTGLVEGDRVADLYAGVGLFAVTLAASGRRVLAIEGDRTAARDLATNAEPFGERLEVERAPVEGAARALRPGVFDAVVLDPPRTGVSKEALDAVVRLRSPRLVYVSCDPATLARDSARLTAAGYRLQLLHPFDLFPNTAHVECVSLFVR
jgi:23S rRNA (uracil1939-C5)-methyltransferase